MTENTNETAQTAPPTLGINDLSAMVQVIDVVSERGAFKGNELESVGVLRGRIIRFIEANRPPAAEEASQSTKEKSTTA